MTDQREQDAVQLDLLSKEIRSLVKVANLITVQTAGAVDMLGSVIEDLEGCASVLERFRKFGGGAEK